MSCEKYQNEILENFGTDILSAETKEHLETCQQCRELLNDLKSARKDFGSDEAFFDIDIEESVEAINQRIDNMEITKVISIPKWKSFVPVAAAIILVVGIGLLIQVPMLFNNGGQSANNGDTNGQLLKLTDDDVSELKQIDYAEFIDDYSSEYDLDRDVLLNDDITEEEYQYLDKHLDIGEIL